MSIRLFAHSGIRFFGAQQVGIDTALYDVSNIDTLPWPATDDGRYARRYLLPFIKLGPQTYIKNIHTDLQILKIDDVILPITITRYHPQNSYVCSPYNHYFAYGQEEFDKLGNPRLETVLRLLLSPIFGYYRHTAFDKVVFVNNWLLSTNLYPKITPIQLDAASTFLIAQFPNRPIIFRSVDTLGNAPLYQALLGLNYRMVFSRQVYYQDVQNPALWQKKQVKVDLSKYRHSVYQLRNESQLTPADVPRMIELYNKLYLEKYSHFNPQFTEAFFQMALENKLLTFKAFHKDGQIDAVMGYFCRNNIMTQPIFGYDTYLPQKEGLYRMLSMQVMLEGQQNGCLINCSAGVGQFKRLRGGVPALEYNAVYDRHLPPRKRLPWGLLKKLLDIVAVPIIQNYGF